MRTRVIVLMFIAAIAASCSSRDQHGSLLTVDAGTVDSSRATDAPATHDVHAAEVPIVESCDGQPNYVRCDDGDGCTSDDVCVSGICVGVAASCDAPPADECLDDHTQRRYSATAMCVAGECMYDHTDSTCGAGTTCANGSCRLNGCGLVWCSITTGGAPRQRMAHVAVWTGTEMLVFGGGEPFEYLTDGGRFNPATNRWAPLPSADFESFDGAAVWTGTEMIVWGGETIDRTVSEGGRFNPTTNTWTPMPTAGAPTLRVGPAAAWTGTEMFIWGGNDEAGAALSDGAFFNPTTNTWRLLPAPAGIAGRSVARAVWTGTELLIWGGMSFDGDAYTYFAEGLRFDPATNHWSSIPATGSPSLRWEQSAIWTGNRMIVWGGRHESNVYNDGASFDPVTNRWEPLGLQDAPRRRAGHSAVWTGTEMIIWGGWTDDSYRASVELDDGYRYSPASP